MFPQTLSGDLALLTLRPVAISSDGHALDLMLHRLAALHTFQTQVQRKVNALSKKHQPGNKATYFPSNCNLALEISYGNVYLYR